MPENEADLRKVEGAVYSIETFGTVDGPGIRYVMFLQGCPLRCLYCHIPDSVTTHWGTIWTAGQAVDVSLRYRTFIKNGGVTFSGGEPLMQAKFVAAATRLLKAQGLHVAIDTAGCMPVQQVKEAIDLADLLLLDIKAYDPDTAKRLSGQSSQSSFETLDYCEATGKPVWIRHVLLKGYTLNDGQLQALAHRLAGYTCVKMVELLPFHKLGEPKWELAGREYTLQKVPATTKEETAAAKAIFEAEGLKVQ
ncbi:MAG: pyruvate formate-lyase-activating protein [Oscillospiraceae bacterium]